MSEEEINGTKRGFLKKGLLSAGAVVLATTGVIGLKQNGLLPSSDSDIPDINKPNPNVPDDPNRHWGFMIDLSKCNGCVDQPIPEDDPTGERPRCTYSCRKSHYLLEADPPQYWIRVFTLQDSEELDPYFFPKPCQNCQDAPCKHVCPTGATFQRKDGTILINQDICIGCRICMAACPYETRFFWYNEPPELPKAVADTEYHPEFAIPYQKGTVVKCDLCIHNTYNGQAPHCVTACPQGAIYFGDFNEDAVSNGREIVKLVDTLNERGGFRYKEDEGTETSCFYLPRSSSLLNLEFDINGQINQNKGEKSKIEILVRDQNGRTVSGRTVHVGKKTNFGILKLGAATTGRSGKCEIQFESGGVSTVIVKCDESEYYALKEVEYNGN